MRSSTFWNHLAAGLCIGLGPGGVACQAPTAAAPVAVPLFESQADRVSVPDGSPLRQRLRVGAAQRQTVRHKLNAPATVEANPSRLARIAAPLAGRVVRLRVRYGDAVTEGQPLLEMDSPDLVQAQTDYIKARSNLSQSERTMARQRDLATHGIGAKRDLEQAQTDLEVAHSDLRRASQRLRLLEIGPGELSAPLTLRSPIAGRVVELGVAAGEVHNDPSVPLLTIADLSTVWLTAHVQEKDLHKVRVGDEVASVFAAYPDENIVGKVFSVGDLLDVETRTIKVRAQLPNADGRFKPGMFATAAFTGGAYPAITVPSSALLLGSERSYVFLETAPWVFARQTVQTGEQIGTMTVITAGLSEGHRLVTQDAVLLQ